jgi:hypothetical protein
MPKPPTKILLKIPPEIAEETNNPTRVELRWTPYHPAVYSSAGAVVSRSNELLDGRSFRAMRDTLGAQLATAQPAMVCRALGLPVGEPGIGA